VQAALPVVRSRKILDHVQSGHGVEKVRFDTQGILAGRLKAVAGGEFNGLIGIDVGANQFAPTIPANPSGPPPDG